MAFEVFEASPRCLDVMAADDALQWDFPGSAVAVPAAVFGDESFLSNLATFLEQASLESTKPFVAVGNKAGSDIAETRDTADPGLVSSMLVALLEANGRRVNPPILRKRVRDDVLWNHSRMPWRRLPLWLILRVSVQRFLSLRLPHEHGRMEYKFFVCVLLMCFAEKVIVSTSMERLSHLKTKICRRLAKLELDSSHAEHGTLADYNRLFDSLGPQFSDGISRVCQHIETVWQRFKSAPTRRIRTLPRRAVYPELRLSLRKSRPYLDNAVSRFQNDTMKLRATKGISKTEENALLSPLPEPYFKLSRLEDHLERQCEGIVVNDDMDLARAGNHCIELAKTIRAYLDRASTPYQSHPDQMGIMLLTVLELWMRLDQAACRLIPFLEEFHPFFNPAVLDTLRLVRLKDMIRLQAIQEHLKARMDRCAGSRQTIFDDPSSGRRCFAERFFDEPTHSANLQDLLRRIEKDADAARKEKQEEWASKTRQYEELSKKISQTACVFLEDPNNPLSRGYHDPRCRRCLMQDQKLKMKITIFEDPLPSDLHMKKVVAFELTCPEPFQAYRDITWYIFSCLASPGREEIYPSKCTIRSYSVLGPFLRSSPSQVMLASRTKSCE